MIFTNKRWEYSQRWGLSCGCNEEIQQQSGNSKLPNRGIFSTNNCNSFASKGEEPQYHDGWMIMAGLLGAHWKEPMVKRKYVQTYHALFGCEFGQIIFPKQKETIWNRYRHSVFIIWNMIISIRIKPFYFVFAS